MRLFSLAFLVACGAKETGPDLGGQEDPINVPAPKLRPAADAATNCAHAFGDLLKDGFGRLDGTLVAIVPPDNTTCAMPTEDHLVLQVKAKGKVYRVLVNLHALSGEDTRMRMQAVEHPKLEGPAFTEGWNTKDVSLDYVENFGLAMSDFKAYDADALIKEVTGWLELNKPISVFANADRGHSAHLLYRTGGKHDGAIVVQPTGKQPVYLVFAFDGAL